MSIYLIIILIYTDNYKVAVQRRCDGKQSPHSICLEHIVVAERLRRIWTQYFVSNSMYDAYIQYILGTSRDSFFVTLKRYLNSPIGYMLCLFFIRALSCL